MYEKLIKELRECSEINSLSHYKRDLMKQAAEAIEKLSKERDKYKMHSDAISKLPDCNTCWKKATGNCEIIPTLGDWVRINCASWMPEQLSQASKEKSNDRCRT